MHASHPDESLSQWSANVTLPQYNFLQENISVDVCIVGGGISGITSAYLLQKEGKNVCILESFELGSGQTGRTTAHFSNVLDDRYFNLEKIHGSEGARLAAQSHSAAIQKVADIIKEEKIDCDFDFVNGYLFVDTPEDKENILIKELEACHKAGLTTVLSREGLPIEGFGHHPNLRFPMQAQLHPLKYIKRLAELIEERGGRIFTRTYAKEIRGGKGASVTTRDGFSVRCGSIIVATNTPINDLVAIHTKQYAYRTYVLAFKIPEGKMEKALYWDTSDPYHYVRTDVDVLIVGGEDHKTGQEAHPENCYQRLEMWTRARFPFAEHIVQKWSGQVMEPMDSLGFLGRNPMDNNNVFVITGDSGNGMTHGTIGAMLITDQIMERKNPWEDLYSPSRISLRAVPTFLKENLNTAAQYVDWVTTEYSNDLRDLPTGEGRVFRNGAHMIATYRNENGAYQSVTAVCPHLGGIVKWNSAEKSWDCPCHGSRFDCHGKVIEGPAILDLKRVDFDQPALITEPVRTSALIFRAPENIAT